MHLPSFSCEHCDESFREQNALELHLREGCRIQQHVDTPLDLFFRSFPEFDYDASLPPATSFANLRRQEQRRHGSSASDDAWARYQDALQGELHMWYGAEDDLAAWHALCRAVGIKPVPTSTHCERVCNNLKKKIEKL